MSAIVFIWEMLRKAPGDRMPGVGHASMSVRGPTGTFYISLWPSEHSLSAGLSSPAKIHFINADKKTDGIPQWASKPLQGLDEMAILQWWKGIQENPIVDFNNKKEFQRSSDPMKNFQMANKSQYSILFNQCATTVVAALYNGADMKMRAKMAAWLACKGGVSDGTAGVILQALGIRIPTITPRDVREMVISIWGD